MTADELRAKSVRLAAAGCATSAAVLRLFEERDASRALVLRLADRVKKQSELLGRKAESPSPATGVTP